MTARHTSHVIADLRERIRPLETGGTKKRLALPFGIPEIDRKLPDGGMAHGALHEIAGGGNDTINAAAAALFSAGIAARTRGKVLWCITRQDLFAPALAQVGLGPERVIYAEAGDQKALLACFEEGLRHGGLGAVIADVASLDMTASRRLQLAAEQSGSIGIAIRRWATTGRCTRFRPTDGGCYTMAGFGSAIKSITGRRRG